MPRSVPSILRRARRWSNPTLTLTLTVTLTLTLTPSLTLTIPPNPNPIPSPTPNQENLPLVEAGAANLLAHIRNVRNHGVSVVVALNRFHTDTDAEVALVKRLAKEGGAYNAVDA